MEDENGLADEQYGFRKARSTVGVVGRVVNLTREAMLSGKCCAVVTVDVKNAFDPANWGRIKESLAKINAPCYLVKLIECYLSGRAF